jgi:hypothetical protein
MRLVLDFQEPKIDFRAHDSKNLIHSSCAFAVSIQIQARLYFHGSRGLRGI